MCKEGMLCCSRQWDPWAWVGISNQDEKMNLYPESIARVASDISKIAVIENTSLHKKNYDSIFIFDLKI